MGNRHVGFLLRVVTFAVLAVAAYAFVLQFVYPRFFAPFVSFHVDEYQGVDFVARGMHATEFLGWPRPLAFLTMFFAGHFGLAGSLVFYTLITLLDLALAMALFERYFLRARIAWWIALLAFVLAIAGPGFYFSVGYDLEFSLAAFFGLLGMYAWESRSPKAIAKSLAACGICFTLSTLSKESFIPAMIVYAVAAAFLRGPIPAFARATLPLLPLAAAAIALVDDRLVGSPFVALNAGSSTEYAISFNPSSIVKAAAFYVAPLFNVVFAAFLAACGAGAWIHRRLRLGIGIAVAAFALYAPYVLLPNHLDVCYRWAPMMLLALLVPLALVSSPDAGRRETWSRIAVGSTLAATVVLFGVASASSANDAFYLSQQRINAHILAALDSAASRIAPAHRVLVTGITYAFYPWQRAAFLKKRLGFDGTWTVATSPEYGPIVPQPSASAIAYDDIRWSDYDLILVFNDAGALSGAYRPAEFARAVARLGLGRESNLAKVGALRGAALASEDGDEGNGLVLVYPKGVLGFADEATAWRNGVYPQPTDQSCCFLAQSARFRIAKPPGARAAIFSFYVPDFAPFEHHPEHVAVAFDGIAAGASDLTLGFQDVRFAIPASLAGGSDVEASLTMSIAFVPKQLGLSADPRTLSVILTQVRFE